MDKVIPAVSSESSFENALKTNAKTVFYLSPTIDNLAGKVEKCHAAGKRIFVHMDLAEGIGKDKLGLSFVKKCGVDGIISTRNSIIKYSKDVGLSTVQRFFIIDSHSVDTTVDTVKITKPDMIEVMPGCVPKIIEKLKAYVTVPIIAGGLIEKAEEINAEISVGAAAVSTGRAELWEVTV